MAEWSMHAAALSPDRRTNVWRITPGCGHKSFVPPTTMLAHQTVECPKCGAAADCNYNTGVIRPREET